MFLLLALLLGLSHTHLIITVTPSNTEVSLQQVIDVQILTSADIPANSLTLSFSNQFTTSSTCRLDTVTTTCSQGTTATTATVSFAAALTANTYYMLSITVTNPIYATNFQITASASGSQFANTGLLAITPKAITCVLSASSPYVGDTAAGLLSLGNDVLPVNSVIVIKSTIQSTFNNLLSPSPTCSMTTTSTTLPCSLATSFGQQFLTMTSLPTNANLSITITNINNSPYNDTLITGSLQIQHQNGYSMQVCSLSQPIPTALRTSTGVTLQNWNSAVGAQSNVTLTIQTYFTPFTQQILIVYGDTFTMAVLAPTIGTSKATQGSNTLDYLDGGVAVGKTLSFLLQITNPPTQQAVVWTVYVIYSSSLFVQSFTYTQLTLSALSLSVSLALSVDVTMSLSSYNCSIVLPHSLGGSPIVTLALGYGQVQCNALNLQSNALLTVVNCSSSSLSVSAVFINQGTLTINFNIANYLSVRGDNLLTVSITGSSPSYSGVGSGSTPIQLSTNSQAFTVVNSNTTFNDPTAFTVTEASSLLLTTGAVRKFVVKMPADLVLVNVIVTAMGTTVVRNYSIVTGNELLIFVEGLLEVVIAGINNPVEYLGSVAWIFTGSDVSDNPSSASQATQTPGYTATTPTIAVQLNDSTIEVQSSMQLTITPTLQYPSTSVITITVTIPNSPILTICSSCTLLSSTSFSLLYSTSPAGLAVSLTLRNSKHPVNNTILVSIASASSIYQAGTLSYALTPTVLGYLVEQTGLYLQLGTVNITLTTSPTAVITLGYSGLGSILGSVSCNSCDNTKIIASGIVQHFDVANVELTGTVNGVVYARATVPVSYVCSNVQGCRICTISITNTSSTTSTTTTLCQQCFSSSLTNNSLLYNGQCLQTCPLSTYSNSLLCIDCQANCQSCDSTACLVCNINYYIYTGTCLGTCPPPLVNNATHCTTVPVICSNNCASCLLQNTCDVCDGGYFLLNNFCYSTCPTNYIADASNTGCVVFIPPPQTSYFPFIFIISGLVLAVALVSVKCYEKRSLVMGNLIAFLSLVQFGSMTMTLVYSFQSSQGLDLLSQAFIFIMLLSKVVLNLSFLVYFIKIIAAEEDFEQWRQQEDSHERLYRILIVLSSTLSFQTIRILYSRLMGLHLFFGKFNTALIFKPLNYFTIAYFCTCGATLIFLSIRNIIAQEGYRTSTFYSSLESIILQLLLLIACIIDNKKGYDDEFFEYQVYKVRNQYESSHIEPIQIEEQVQNAGSMHEMLNAVKEQEVRGVRGARGARDGREGRSSQIVRNPMWVRKLEEGVEMNDAEMQSDLIEENQLQKEQMGLVTNIKIAPVKDKKESLFRKKIIDDWRKLESTLPRHIKLIKNEIKSKKKSISPEQKKTVHKALKRCASLEEFEVKLPEYAGSLPEKIKNYFYQLENVPKDKREPVEGAKRGQGQAGRRKTRQRRLNKDRQKVFDDNGGDLVDDEFEFGEPKIATMEVERGTASIETESDQHLLHKQLEDESANNNNSVNTEFPLGKGQNHLYIINQEQTTMKKDNLNNELQEQSDQREVEGEDLEEVESLEEDHEALEEHNNGDRPYNGENQNENEDNTPQLNSHSNLNNQVDCRYEQQDKMYRTKKRRVNRQTEGVYLQRLTASSDRKVRSKARKMDF